MPLIECALRNPVKNNAMTFKLFGSRTGGQLHECPNPRRYNECVITPAERQDRNNRSVLMPAQFAPARRLSRDENHPIEQNQIEPTRSDNSPGVYACADECALQSCRIEIRANTFCDGIVLGNQRNMPRRRFRGLNSAVRRRNVSPIQGSQFLRLAGNGLDAATVGSEGVSSAAYCADRIVIVMLHQGLSQPSDMNVNGAPVDEGIASPNPIEQLLARQYAARILHEVGEQLVLGRAEAYLAAATGDAMRQPIEHDVAGLQRISHAIG
jgi:hypothetical protein